MLCEILFDCNCLFQFHVHADFALCFSDKQVPNRYAECHNPSLVETTLRPHWPAMKTLLFITTKPIAKGEELFVNYRFNPQAKRKHPKWYHAIDPEEDAMRWDTQSDKWWRQMLKFGGQQ